jgi:hypothetical protein
MNYQLLQIPPTNYQLDQNRAFNYHSYILCPLPSVKVVKIDGQRVMCDLRAVQAFFTPLLSSAVVLKRQKYPQLKMSKFEKYIPVELHICPYFIIQNVWNAP